MVKFCCNAAIHGFGLSRRLNFIHGAKGMCYIIKVFSKAVGLVIVSEGGFVLLVSRGNPPTVCPM